MKNILFLLLAVSFLGCEEDGRYDDDLSGRWNLRSMQLLQPVDLNRDGVASTDMITEFDCLRAENILISLDGTRFTYNQTTMALDGDAFFSCNITQSRQTGNVSKPERHIVRLHFKNANPQFMSEYSIHDGILTKIYTASFPVEFNPATQTWSQSSVQIKKTYKR